jgi:hypothetical protein
MTTTLTPPPLRVKTRTLPGKRLEMTLPELEDGEEVEVIVLRAESPSPPQQYANMMEFICSLTPIERTSEEWAEVERELQEDRNSWDD